MLPSLNKAVSQNQAGMKQLLLDQQSKNKRLSLGGNFNKKASIQLKNFRQKKISREIAHKPNNRDEDKFSNFLNPIIYPYKGDIQNLKALKLYRFTTWDLTWALANINLSNALLVALFSVIIIVRYISILFAIYLIVRIQVVFWEIFLFLFICVVLYWMSLVKVSLKTAETNTQILLTCYFDSLSDNQKGEYFRKIQKKKLIINMIKGLIPPELSFLYIGRLQSPRKKKTYLILNFIYCSSEAIVYIPCYLISFSVRQIQNKSIQKAYVGIVILLLSTWTLFALLCIALVCKSRSQEYVPID